MALEFIYTNINIRRLKSSLQKPLQIHQQITATRHPRIEIDQALSILILLFYAITIKYAISLVSSSRKLRGKRGSREFDKNT
jgi:hypothetical protein